jgi:hypothetical protein
VSLYSLAEKKAFHLRAGDYSEHWVTGMSLLNKRGWGILLAPLAIELGSLDTELIQNEL